MKKILSGTAIMITGAILLLSVFIAGSFNLQVIVGWDSVLGRFWTSIGDINLTPMVVVSIIIMLVGAGFLIRGNIENSDK